MFSGARLGPTQNAESARVHFGKWAPRFLEKVGDPNAVLGGFGRDASEGGKNERLRTVSGGEGGDPL